MKLHPFLSTPKLTIVLFSAILSLTPSVSVAKKQKPPTSTAEELHATQPWPPAYLAKMPQDYLDRLHQALLVMIQRGVKVRLAPSLSGTPSDKNSLGWIRLGLAGIPLGVRVDEINTYIASRAFVWPRHEEFSFAFFSTTMLHFYALFHSNSPYMPGHLTPEAQANLEKGMWGTVKLCKLADARRSPWLMHGSQNHSLMEMGGELLATQFLRKVPAYASQKCDDGTDLETMYQAWKKQMNEWLDTRARAGLFTEWGSPSYDADCGGVIHAMRDFAEDPVLRKKAEMFLNLYYAAVAEDTIASGRGGAKMRTKGGNDELRGIK